MKPDLHPACALWPKMAKADLEELADDIKARGQLEEITLCDGKILDGSNRWDACEIAGVIPRTVLYAGSDPIGFVLARNKLRRHMSADNLALVTAQLVTLKQGDNAVTSVRGQCINQLATQAGISTSAIDRARSILAHGGPEVINAVQTGQVSLSAAANAVQNNSKEAQVGWTAQDIKRESRKAENARPSTQKRRSDKVDKPEPNRPTPIKFPTAEETGFPVNGTMAERDAHHRKYGRTPLHPKVVKDMLNNEAMIAGYMQAIISATNSSHPSAIAFFEAIDQMLGWVPQPEKGDDYGINFALKAKNHLKLLAERLPILVERSTQLSEALNARK